MGKLTRINFNQKKNQICECLTPYSMDYVKTQQDSIFKRWHTPRGKNANKHPGEVTELTKRNEENIEEDGEDKWKYTLLLLFIPETTKYLYHVRGRQQLKMCEKWCTLVLEISLLSWYSIMMQDTKIFCYGKKLRARKLVRDKHVRKIKLLIHFCQLDSQITKSSAIKRIRSGHLSIVKQPIHQFTGSRHHLYLTLRTFSRRRLFIRHVNYFVK